MCDSSLRVLLVDDDSIHQRLGLRLLRRLGHTVHAASDGYQALRTLRETAYDVVFMDLRMPGLDGIATWRKFMNQQPDALPQLILMSSSIHLDDVTKCQEAGITHLIEKPLSRRVIETTLQETMEGTYAVPAFLPPIDDAVLRNLRDVQTEGNLAFFCSLLDHFLKDAAQSIEEMRGAYQQRDHNQVRFLAHKLLSSSRLFGAQRVSALCAYLEKHPPTELLMENLQEEFEQAASLLKRRVPV